MNNVWLMRQGLEDHEKDARRECSQEGFQTYFELREDKAGGGDKKMEVSGQSRGGGDSGDWIARKK